MTEGQQLKLRLAILRILAEINLLLMPEPELLGQLQIEVTPAPSTVEFRSAVEYLKNNALILSSRTTLGGPLKWKITELGMAALAES